MTKCYLKGFLMPRQASIVAVPYLNFTLSLADTATRWRKHLITNRIWKHYLHTCSVPKHVASHVYKIHTRFLPPNLTESSSQKKNSAYSLSAKGRARQDHVADIETYCPSYRVSTWSTCQAYRHSCDGNSLCDLATKIETRCSEGGAGNSLALEFAAQGCRVFATARSLKTLGNLSAAGIEVFTLDVTSQESIDALKAGITSLTHGKLDVLYNNAGVCKPYILR